MTLEQVQADIQQATQQIEANLQKQRLHAEQAMLWEKKLLFAQGQLSILQPQGTPKAPDTPAPAPAPNRATRRRAAATGNGVADAAPPSA